MDPAQAGAIVESAAEQVELALGAGGRPVLLCSARVRRHLRRLCEQALPQLPVCSYNEVMPGIRVETVGVVNG
jgi:flagellar biosynthesis protein FlhA